MIEDSPQNRMIGRSESVRSSDHIREIGPHSHRWSLVGRDPTGESYQECIDCGTRRATSGDLAGARRQDWLQGGEWEPKAEEGEQGGHEDFTFPRRRGRPPKNGNGDHSPDQEDG